MSNIRANKPFLENAMATLLSYNNGAPASALNKFLNAQTQANYDALWTSLTSAQDAIVANDSANLGPTGPRTAYKFRFLITMDDGTTVMDSSRADGASNGSANYVVNGVSINNKSLVPNVVNNPASGVVTYANNFFYYQNKQVNENHHSRPEILLALLSNNGNGFSERFSSSVSSNLLYLAQRIGTNSQKNVGTIRISVVDL